MMKGTCVTPLSRGHLTFYIGDKIPEGEMIPSILNVYILSSGTSTEVVGRGREIRLK